VIRALDGRVAAVTGAASGIGRALAIALAHRGCHLALADVDVAGLDDTVATCRRAGVTVTAQHLDVSDRAAVERWAVRVVEEHGRVNLVVNNAGVALIADVAEMAHEDLEWLMAVDYWGVVHGTTAFLPHLASSGEGHVVNISSVFGLVSIPSQSAYNSAKFAVRGFTDALRIELDIARSPVSATTVHPGGIRTDIVRNARSSPGAPLSDPAEFDRLARTTPERAAAVILAGVLRNRRRVLVGADARVFDLVSRMPASVSQGLLVAAARWGKRARARGGDPQQRVPARGEVPEVR
jgi:butyryl-CoA dehydrogenase